MPTKHCFQPPLQQVGVRVGHAQYFCMKQNPIPVVVQSVTRQVGRDSWNGRTPSFISLLMTDLDSSKIALSSLVHLKGFFGLRRWRKGCIRCALENAYAPWLTRPNHARGPVTSLGSGNLLIVSRNRSDGVTFVGVMMSPAKSTVSCAN